MIYPYQRHCVYLELSNFNASVWSDLVMPATPMK